MITYLLFLILIGLGILFEKLNEKAVRAQQPLRVIELIDETIKRPLDEAYFASLERPVKDFWPDIDFINKLIHVKIALASANYDNINNELIPYTEVTKPILLLKQYQSEGTWYNVPSYCHITDHHALLQWLSRYPTHPTNNDVITNPNAYNMLPTRYIWHDLTKHFMPTMDLIDLCEQLDKFTLKESSLPKVSSFPQSLFAAPKLQPDESQPSRQTALYRFN